MVLLVSLYIADKGFYSTDNIKMLDRERLQYIIPLRRNNPLIDFSILQQPEFKRKIKFFSYQNRIIWYYSYAKDDNLIITFLDEHLRVSEENDYLNRTKTHPEKYSIDSYYENWVDLVHCQLCIKFLRMKKHQKQKREQRKQKMQMKYRNLR